jgi:hypothetical protein
MAMTRSEIDSILEELEVEVPMLLQDGSDPEDFWMTFAALSDALEDGANPQDLGYIRERIDGILGTHGLAAPERKVGA